VIRFPDFPWLRDDQDEKRSCRIRLADGFGEFAIDRLETKRVCFGKSLGKHSFRQPRESRKRLPEPLERRGKLQQNARALVWEVMRLPDIALAAHEAPQTGNVTCH